jgi:anti-anti-sigma factor
MSDDRQMFRATPTEDGTLALRGELDALAVRDLNAALASGNGAGPMTLDVSELTFIDSAGLHAIAAYARSREPEGTVTLTGASPHVVRVFEITCLATHPRLRIDGAA